MICHEIWFQHKVLVEFKIIYFYLILYNDLSWNMISAQSTGWIKKIRGIFFNFFFFTMICQKKDFYTKYR